MIIDNNDYSDMIYIPSEVYSKKNSKQLYINNKTGRPCMTSNKPVKRYTKQTEIFYITNRNKFQKITKDIPFPLIVQFTFVRRSKKIFDHINLMQLPLDLMTKHKWILDDNINYICPIPNPIVIYDSYNAGIFIEPLTTKEKIKNCFNDFINLSFK